MAEPSQHEARLRSEELRARINHHNHRYYVLDAPEISDGESGVISSGQAASRARSSANSSSYSPYPRLDEGGREGFGSEKYAAYAGEGEVHLYAGCRTLPR